MGLHTHTHVIQLPAGPASGEESSWLHQQIKHWLQCPANAMEAVASVEADRGRKMKPVAHTIAL